MSNRPRSADPEQIASAVLGMLASLDSARIAAATAAVSKVLVQHDIHPAEFAIAGLSLYLGGLAALFAPLHGRSRALRMAAIKLLDNTATEDSCRNLLEAAKQAGIG